MVLDLWGDDLVEREASIHLHFEIYVMSAIVN